MKKKFFKKENVLYFIKKTPLIAKEVGKYLK